MTFQLLYDNSKIIKNKNGQIQYIIIWKMKQHYSSASVQLKINWTALWLKLQFFKNLTRNIKNM